MRTGPWQSSSWRGPTAATTGFTAEGGTWFAISSAGEVLTGGTPDALSRAIRAHWQAMRG